jgi:HprK-related kinase A
MTPKPGERRAAAPDATSSAEAQNRASAVARALGGAGLHLDLGLVRVRVRAQQVWPAAGQIASAYRHFPLAAPQQAWADIHVDLRRGKGLRRWFRPQTRLLADGVQAFEPFAAALALPLLEWGVNWLIGRRVNDRLLLHAGTLARDGRAVVMPALPGSGKSTLTAALALRGWRLLSDEFGACDPATGLLHPCVKPVALKNESIDVIRRFAPQAELGPAFPGTRKGTVAHLAPSAESVSARHQPATPALLLIPRWQAGSATVLERIRPEAAFSSLAFNAFNYTALGALGFETVVALVRRMALWRLVYSDLDDALRRIDGLWAELTAGDLAGPVGAEAGGPPSDATGDAHGR